MNSIFQTKTDVMVIHLLPQKNKIKGSYFANKYQIIINSQSDVNV